MHMRCCNDIFSYCSQSDTVTGYIDKCPSNIKKHEGVCLYCECQYLMANSYENPLKLTAKEQEELDKKNAMLELAKEGKVKLSRKEKKELGVK